METLKLDISSLKKEEDLIYYDGPILSVYRDEKEKPYLFFWVDYTSEFNTWLITSPNEEILGHFQCGSVDLTSTMKTSEIFLLVDVDRDCNYLNFRDMDIERQGKDYFPKGGYLFV